MFGDNDSAVNSSMIPQGKIRKRYAASSFRRVREVIAAKVMSYQFVSGKFNPADILSKHCAHHCPCPTLKPLLFCSERFFLILEKYHENVLPVARLHRKYSF